jgi:hypothetical protein
MNAMQQCPARLGTLRRILPLALAGGLVLAWLLLAPKALSMPVRGVAATAGPSATSSAAATTSAPPAKLPASATLQQCVNSSEQTQRSATFAGEMTAVKGASKMEMRIDVLERMPREVLFHAVSSPGLGVWRIAAPGVKTYRYLKEVTNLSAPAFYRAAVHFRWLNAKGKLIRATELRTPRCQQPAGLAGGHSPTEEPAPRA